MALEQSLCKLKNSNFIYVKTLPETLNAFFSKSQFFLNIGIGQDFRNRCTNRAKILQVFLILQILVLERLISF